MCSAASITAFPLMRRRASITGFQRPFGFLPTLWSRWNIILSVTIPPKSSFADGEVYEIIYAEPGKEQLINQMLSTVKEVPPKYIVLIEQPEQIAEIHTPNTSGYCTVSSGGEVQYYQIE